MTEPLPGPVARRLRLGDRNRLGHFTCSNGVWYEDAVQDFVQTKLHEYVERHAEHLATRVVLLVDPEDQDDIWAVGVHEVDDQRTDAGVEIEGTRLVVAAVRADLQGRVIDVEPSEDERPVTVGRFLIETLVEDAPVRPGVFRAIVARDNHRSLKLCARLGLSEQRSDRDERYVQLLGKLD